MRLFEKTIIFIASLFGFSGVVLLSLAAHNNQALEPAGNFLLFHAPLLIGIVLLLKSNLIGIKSRRLSAVLIASGAAMFCGAIALRVLFDLRPIPNLAPIGGGVMIVGWLVLALSSLLRIPSNRR